MATGIDGLRTELDGLGEFMSMGPAEASPHGDSVSEATSIERAVESRAFTAREDPRMAVRSVGGSRSEAEPPAMYPNSVTARESVVLESTGPRRPIPDYLEEQQAIESLLAVAFWRRPRVLSRQVLLRNNPGTNDQANPWSYDLLTPWETQPGRVEFSLPTPLFRYVDGSPDMFDSWFVIWGQKPRAIRPLANLPAMHGALPETRLLTAGAGLEALGYYLAVDATKSKHSAKDEPLAVKLQRVVDALPDGMTPLLGDEPPKTFKDAYMAVKHADRGLPRPRELQGAYAWGVRLFRLWTATQLGSRQTRVTKRHWLSPDAACRSPAIACRIAASSCPTQSWRTFDGS